MKVDKAVCTNDTLEDLSKAIKYEAVFTTLFENKILAIKRECEEKKKAKRLKRKSLGRVLFGRRIFGGSTTSTTSIHTSDIDIAAGGDNDGSGAGGSGVADGNDKNTPGASTSKRKLPSGYEGRRSASIATEKGRKSESSISYLKRPFLLGRISKSLSISEGSRRASNIVSEITVPSSSVATTSAETPDDVIAIESGDAKNAKGVQVSLLKGNKRTEDESEIDLTSSLSSSMKLSQPVDSTVMDDSNGSNGNGSSLAGDKGARDLVVEVITHREGGGYTTYDSSEKHDPSGLVEKGTITSASGTITSSAKETAINLDSKTSDDNSDMIPKDKHTQTTMVAVASTSTTLDKHADTSSLSSVHIIDENTSTIADESLTSIRGSIESLSFPSSRYTISAVIPVTTTALSTMSSYYDEELRKQRILEAKSISAQCSPILPIRHYSMPAQQHIRFVEGQVSYTDSHSDIHPTTTYQHREQRHHRQYSSHHHYHQHYPNPEKLHLGKETFKENLDRTEEEQKLENVQQVERQESRGASDDKRHFSRQTASEDSANLTTSTLLHEADSSLAYNNSSKICVYNLDERKSRSASLLLVSDNYNNNSNMKAIIDHFNNDNTSSRNNYESNQLKRGSISSFNQLIANKLATEDGVGLSRSYPVPPAVKPISENITTITRSSSVVLRHEKKQLEQRENLPNNLKDAYQSTISIQPAAIVPTTVIPCDTAKLQRMTSTSTGSSVAPTGCCVTKSSSSKDKRISNNKPDWQTSQSGSDDEFYKRKRKYKRYHRCSDPVLVYPSSGSLQHCILSMPPNQPIEFHYNDDFVYDITLQVEADKNGDLQAIVPSQRVKRHRHHKHKKRNRHKKPKILVHDLDTQSVKVIDPDDLPQRARWTIIATACLLLLMCLMLVGITLRMAPIIDDMEHNMRQKCPSNVIFDTNYAAYVEKIKTDIPQKYASHI